MQFFMSVLSKLSTFVVFVPSRFTMSLHFHPGMHMGLGGNPYGPAGTGKTESVKALGGLFGRQVLVFNCDEVRQLNAFLHPKK